MPQWMVVTIQQDPNGNDTASYRDLLARAWYHSTAAVSDSSNTFITQGDFPNVNTSKNVSIPFNGGSQLLHEARVRVTKQYGSTTNAHFGASITGINYWGESQTVWDTTNYTVPARAYASPTAPSNVSVSRNSDTSHTVTWTRNASTAGRYQSQRVQRLTQTAGTSSGWQTVHTINTNYTTSGNHSWTDTGTRADRSYRYRVQAVNSTSTSTSGASIFAYTTPGTPSSVVASKLSSGDIRVRITPGHSTNNVQYVIQHSTNNGSTWSALGTIAASLPGSTDYTHTSPNPAQTHRYRVQARVDHSGAQGNGLTSGWATSANVQLAAPPNAPTGLGPSAPWDPQSGIPRIPFWTHNPVDSSEEEFYEIEYATGGSGAWISSGKLPSDGPAWEFPNGISQNDTVDFQVRTWGQHPDPSPWSSVATFVTSARPTAAINAPDDGETLPDSTLAVSWTYYQSVGSPQAQWRATLLNADASTVLEVRSGSGARSQVAFNTPGGNGESYVIRVEVASAVGLWSEPVDVHVDVVYLPPALVDADLSWDRDRGAVALDLTPQNWDDSATVEPVAVTVQRSSDGGASWHVVAREYPLGGGTTSLTDYTPPTRAELLYHVTSISALPSQAANEPVAITVNETKYAYLNWGDDFSTALTCYGNLAVASQVRRARSVEQFAGRVGPGGEPAGVVISGPQRSRQLSGTVTLLHGDGMATREDFEDAELNSTTVFWRDPSGENGRAIEAALMGVGAASPAMVDHVSLTLEQVGPSHV